MNTYSKLNHTTWDCKYHLVWIPKYRKKAIYGNLRANLGEVFRELALHKESQIIEGHLMGNHIHMLISISPKYAVSQVVGYIKGKKRYSYSKDLWRTKTKFHGQSFWARGYFVSTVGRDEGVVRTYIKRQKEADSCSEQMSLF